MTNSRKALVEAQADLKDAVGRHGYAQSSTATAKAYAANAEAAAQKLKDKFEGVKASRTIALIDSLKRGKNPAGLEAREQMVELDHALSVADMARQALAAIEGEERDAEKVVAAAKAKVAKAIKAVIRDEAEAMADRVEGLEAESHALRAHLGMTSGFVSTQLHPVGAQLSRIMLKSEQMPEIGTTNTPLFLKAKASGTGSPRMAVLRHLRHAASLGLRQEGAQVRGRADERWRRGGRVHHAPPAFTRRG